MSQEHCGGARPQLHRTHRGEIAKIFKQPRTEDNRPETKDRAGADWSSQGIVKVEAQAVHED